MALYRGNGGMALPRDFFELDEQGCAGGTECTLMSTTPDRSEALGYVGVNTGKELLGARYGVSVTVSSSCTCARELLRRPRTAARKRSQFTK